MARGREFIDITYSLFIAAAVGLLMIIVVEGIRDSIELTDETSERIGFLLLFPLAACIFCGGIGILLAVFAWKEWPLPVLAGLEVLILLSAITNAASGMIYTVVGIYLALCIFFSLRWFGLKRRYRL